MTFERYLNRLGFSRGTIATYLYQINNFLTSYPDAAEFKYNDILCVLEQ